jgi:ferric-dicitrate binding protein FerR (iron transport regulator)
MEKYALFHRLLNDYLLGTITEEETRQFFALLEDPACRDLLAKHLGHDLDEETFTAEIDPQLIPRIQQRLAARRKAERTPGRIGYRSIAAIAAAVLFVAAGIGIWIRQERTSPVLTGKQQSPKTNDIPPGKNGAILTLADGTTIDLDSTNGNITRQGNTKITKTNGLLAYKASDNRQAEVLYNTVTVPPAHQIQLSLADGSKVWLNASSSLRFPAAFTGGRRTVELTGEGYFEVAPKAGQPFAVRTGGIEVQDIGTQFNIMAYSNEPAIRTTLVQGAVKVVSGGRSALLRPNEQADVTKEAIAVQQDADVEAAIAWKNGLFLVNGADLASVLRQMSRWYDVEIVYTGEMPKGHMIADIPRTMNLSHVIELLRQFGISCELQGKKLIIAG